MAFQWALFSYSIAPALDIPCPSSSGRSIGERKQDVDPFM